MSRQISELESILSQMIVEHKKLLDHLTTQQAAMTTCDLKKMDESRTLAEACRLRILGLDQRRRVVVGQIAVQLKLGADVTLGQIAASYPPRAQALLALRRDLKAAAEQVKARAYIAGRVAGAVLGHLNTVVRLIAGAVGKAGLYNKRGVPRIANRIGVMERVG